MNNTIYDVFISYRRDGGGATAGRINDMLMADGYSVSYDINTLREGRFDTKLLERIEQCQDFILVVDKNCFDRTIDPVTDPQEDWLWRELAYAIKLKKNIIPVLMTGASYPKRLPDDINDVRNYNGPRCIHEYFDDFYKKLREFLHAYPRMAKSPSQKLSNLKIKADMDCVFYLDGEEKAHLKAGAIQKFQLVKGEYELKFVSEDNSNDFEEIGLEMLETDKILKVSLRSLRDSRIQKEAEAKRIAEKQKTGKKRLEDDGKSSKKHFVEEEPYEVSNLVEIERNEVGGQRPFGLKRREDETTGRTRIFTVDHISFKMIYVEGGRFQMGSSDDDNEASGDEKPLHWVTLRDYYIAETQVTQALWKAVMGNNPSMFTGENNPVEFVSWDDCHIFIMELNELMENQVPRGYFFALPTEAQWEFAAKGGKNSRGYLFAGSNRFSDVAWHNNIGSSTHPVKEKEANELGLFDMSGNVWEWCEDFYDSSYYSKSPENDPRGPSSGYRGLFFVLPHVRRGGGYCHSYKDCRVASRASGLPNDRESYIGFRLALVRH